VPELAQWHDGSYSSEACPTQCSAAGTAGWLAGFARVVSSVSCVLSFPLPTTPSHPVSAERAQSQNCRQEISRPGGPAGRKSAALPGQAAAAAAAAAARTARGGARAPAAPHGPRCSVPSERRPPARPCARPSAGTGGSTRPSDTTGLAGRTAGVTRWRVDSAPLNHETPASLCLTGDRHRPARLPVVLGAAPRTLARTMASSPSWRASRPCSSSCSSLAAPARCPYTCVALAGQWQPSQHARTHSPREHTPPSAERTDRHADTEPAGQTDSQTDRQTDRRAE
jgi:hypothetical protein